MKLLHIAYYRVYGLVGRLFYRFKLAYKIGHVRFYVATDAKSSALLGKAIAVHMGHDVYAKSKKALTPEVIRHEMKHVQQFDHPSGDYIQNYGNETERRWYYKNKFERAARRAERSGSRTDSWVRSLSITSFPVR